MEKEIKLCIKCGKRAIYIKKRGLCPLCYLRLRREKGPFSKLTNKHSANKLALCHNNEREIEFIKNYFNHNHWIHQPAIFYFGTNSYKPDFYDQKRGAFIEVSGSRQAYHANKDKYALFVKAFPAIKFEVRRSDGELLIKDKNDRHIWAIK